MNKADKAEAIRLLKGFQPATLGNLADLYKVLAIIERQDDTDGERWRFCLEHGFPFFDWRLGGAGKWTMLATFHEAATPNEVVDTAMAAMKEKA